MTRTFRGRRLRKCLFMIPIFWLIAFCETDNEFPSKGISSVLAVSFGPYKKARNTEQQVSDQKATKASSPPGSPSPANSADFTKTMSASVTTIVAPPRTIRRLANALYRGMTFPFPTLRQLLSSDSESSSTKPRVGLSIREAVVAIIIYLFLGAISYHFSVEALSLKNNPWSLVEAMYFSMVTCTSVGYGDLVPTTVLGKSFTVIFGLVGISALGTAIATIGSKFVESEQSLLKNAQDIGRQQLLGFWNDADDDGNSSKSQIPQTTIPLWKQTLQSLINTSIPAFSALILGGLYMGHIEGWSLIDSIYYSFVTALTLGYGDIVPSTKQGRLWAIIFIPLAVAAAGEVLGNVASTIMERRQTQYYQNLINRDLNMNQLIEMDTNKNGKVSREEYVQFMLKEMDLVSEEQFQELHDQFQKLDVDKGGYLNKNDLKLLIAKRQTKASSS